jgi:DNA (cytosine-5)-methyltransferase 1
MNSLTLGSLFDGIGGFPLAAERCGIKTVWASEIEPNCVSITRRHFPDIIHLGDITKIDGGAIPPVDIISFGSPCQDLSTAGKQRGLDGERSGLFLEAARIIEEMRIATNGEYPTFIIWENVPGAFGSNGGADFRKVLETLTKTDFPTPKGWRWAQAGTAESIHGSGGANVAWRQLDAQYWGVPQRRKRIFLVGDFRAERAEAILFECESVCGYLRAGGAENKKTSSDAESGINAASGDGVRIVDQKAAGFSWFASRGAGSVGYAEEKCPTVRATKPPAVIDMRVYPINEGSIYGAANGFGIGDDGDPAPTLTVRDRHGIATCFMPSGHGGYSEGVGTLRASAGPHGASSANIVIEPKAHMLNGFGGFAEGVGTLRVNGGNNGGGSETLIIESEVRKLTPLECERLQGFPDEWTRYADTGKELADTPRYTALGNSLAVPCAERVFRGIVAVMAEGSGGNEIRA